jgi:hypothetical protein
MIFVPILTAKAVESRCLDLQFGFDILAPVLATFPNFGQIFIQFSGHSGANIHNQSQS